MRVRILHSNGVQTVREADYWNKPEDASPYRGHHVATLLADGQWRLYSSTSDTTGWPLASAIEAAAFNKLPVIEERR